jgi:Na+/melibiose symporter-like transporter
MQRSDRNFRLLWLGQAVSTTGDSFALVAMPLLILDVTGSVTQMGYVTALACAGQIAMSLVSGIIVDRMHRRGLMIASDLGRMVLYGVLPLAWWLGTPRLWLIYVVAALASALGNLFSVGYVTGIANVVEKQDLPRANGRLQATQALTYSVGPLMAGVACSRFGPAGALVFDAASFGVSALSLAAVRFRNERAERVVGAGGKGAARELLAGLSFLGEQPVLRAMTGIMLAVGLLASAGLTAAVIDLFVFHLRQDLAKSSRVVGLCLGVSALGALVGAIAAPRLKKRFGFGACFLGGTGLQAFGLGVAGAFATSEATILGAMCWAGGLTLRAVPAISVRQELTPDSLLGRVTAASWTVIFGAATLGSVFVTHLAAAVGASHALATIGMALALVVFVGSRTAVRSAGAS